MVVKIIYLYIACSDLSVW